MPFCPECGNENQSDQKFCTNCGALLPKSANGALQSQGSGVPHGGQPPKGTMVPPAASAPAAKKPAGLLIGMVIVIALVAAGLLFALPLLAKSSPEKSITPAPTAAPVTTAPAVLPDTTVPTTPGQALTTIVPATTATPSPYKTYTSSRFGFSIDYPAGWTVNETNALELPSTTRYDVIEFYSPTIDRCNTDMSDCSKVRAAFIVEVETEPRAKDIADYFVPESARLLAENGGQITKRDAMYKLSGVKAYRLDYTNEVNRYAQDLISAYTLINGKAYILTYKAYEPMRDEPNLFENYYNTANDMFTSFQAAGAVRTL